MSAYKIFDLHSDLLTFSNDENIIKNKLNKINESADNRVIQALFCGKRSWNEAEHLLGLYHCFAPLIAFEDCSYIEEESLEDTEKLFICLLKYNPAYISLTWNYETVFAGGVKSGAGLKECGKRLIELANSAKIPIDVAHLNKKSFFDVVSLAERVVCSHTAFSDVHFHPRNIDAEMVSLLLQKNAIIGVCAVGYFLSEKPSEQAFYRHIDWYLQKFGVRGLCIGSDFYGSDNLIYADGDYNEFKKLENYLENNLNLAKKDVCDVLYKNAERYYFG